MLPDGLSKQERAFFSVAKEVSLLSNHKQKLGCIVVDKHKIISSGHNSQTKYHRVQAELDKRFFKLDSCIGPVHAEVDALIPLIKRRYNLNSATVYIYRQDKAGNLAMARPCERCLSLLKQQGVKKIKYTTPDGFASERLI